MASVLSTASESINWESDEGFVVVVVSVLFSTSPTVSIQRMSQHRARPLVRIASQVKPLTHLAAIETLCRISASKLSCQLEEVHLPNISIQGLDIQDYGDEKYDYVIIQLMDGRWRMYGLIEATHAACVRDVSKCIDDDINSLTLTLPDFVTLVAKIRSGSYFRKDRIEPTIPLELSPAEFIAVKVEVTKVMVEADGSIRRDPQTTVIKSVPMGTPHIYINCEGM